MTQSSSITQLMQKVSITKYISFSTVRLPLRIVGICLPEVLQFEKAFGSFNDTKKLIEKCGAFNQMILRGDQMRLPGYQTARRLRCRTVDQYILQEHTDCIIDCLKSVVIFASRMFRILENNRTAKYWWINRLLLVHKRHWKSFLKKTAVLLHALDLQIEMYLSNAAALTPNLERLRYITKKTYKRFSSDL